jgi:hypothetical protein
VPVIAGGVERIVDALPRGALGFLKQNAHVPPLVGDLRSSAEMLGDGRKQLVTWTMIAVSGTRADRSRGPPTHPARATRFRRHRPGSPARGRAGSRRLGSGRAHGAAARCCYRQRPDLRSSQERKGIPRLRQEKYEPRCANEILKSARVSFVSVDARPGTCAKRRPPRRRTSQGRSRLRWVEVSERRGGSAKLRALSSDRSCGSCGRPLPSL